MADADRITTGRPPALFPLFAGIETLPGIGPKAADALGTMGVTRPRDLIFTLPTGGVSRRAVDSIKDLRPPEIATLTVTVCPGSAGAWEWGARVMTGSPGAAGPADSRIEEVRNRSRK